MENEYQVQNPRKSGLKILTLVLLLCLITVVVFVLYYFNKISQPGADQSATVNLTIPKGSGSRVVARLLTDEKLIRNPNVFLAYTIVHNASGKIKAGDYVLDRKMSIVEIVDVLTAGKVTRQEKKVTIIEGWTNKQLSNNLAQRGVSNAADFNSAATADYSFRYASIAKPLKYEGFLFPDTYQISDKEKANALFQKALKNFESKFTDKMAADTASRKMSVGQVITMASIIEREVGRSSSVDLTPEVLNTMKQERQMVASVFYNRIKLGMALQSDATVNYATGKSDRSVTIDDTKIDSPYNTYKYRGLPPGPICNPGIDSINAAIYPIQTDYLYFLSKPDGEAVFAKTLAEHNANKAKYLK